MCGICGIWDFKNKIEESFIRKMNDSLKHRGPDDEGVFLSSNNNVGLAQRRLSILDLSPAGHQPMKAGDCWITFNGEVYNFKEIKKCLEQKGRSFSSASDTEVILKSYSEWGIGSVEKFRGMFAYAVWDEVKQKMFLVRDRAGIKPLYYYWDGQLLVFASEIKAIFQHPMVKKELDFRALGLFLQMGCVPAPYSIFQNVYKLEAGCYLEINQRGNMQKIKYWDVADYYLRQLNPDSWDINEEDARQNLEEILLESFKSRMVSDVEVGMFLSGGVDSSAVAALLTKKLGFNNIKTFTIGFQEKEYNEAGYAKKIAEYLGTDHHEFYCSAKEAMAVLPKMPEIYDEPFGDNSAIPTYLVSQFARQFVKVSLSADGGDETFAGYDRYMLIDGLYGRFHRWPKLFLKLGALGGQRFSTQALVKIYKTFQWFLPKTGNLEQKVAKLKRKMDKLGILLKNPNDIILFYQLLGYGFWKFSELPRLLRDDNIIDSFDYLSSFFANPNLKKLDNISQMQLMDYKTYMADDILVKVDRATMACGLEGRDPLLDHKIIEYVAGLPLHFKYRDGVTKYLLRKILYKYVPRELLERPKQGFSVPLRQWLRGDLKYLLDDYLSESRIKRGGIFNWDLIKQEKDNFVNNKADYVDHLWLLIVFEMWKERWL